MNDNVVHLDTRAAIKAHMKAHRVTYTVSWELPQEEWTTDKYFHNEETHLRERLASGQPVTVEFLSDVHDFGDGNEASISRETGPAPWEVLRMVADDLEREAYGDDRGDDDEDDDGCEP